MLIGCCGARTDVEGVRGPVGELGSAVRFSADLTDLTCSLPFLGNSDHGLERGPGKGPARSAARLEDRRRPW